MLKFHVEFIYIYLHLFICIYTHIDPAGFMAQTGWGSADVGLLLGFRGPIAS